MEIKIKVPVGAKLVVDWEQGGLDDGPLLPGNLEAKIEELTSEIHLWIGATGFSSAEEAVESMPRLNTFHAIENELSEWREAAKQRGFKSPMDLRGHGFQTGMDNLRELSAWRSAAKKCQFDSPEELAGAADLTAGQFIDGALNKKWQKATGAKDPNEAYAQKTARDQDLLTAHAEIDRLHKAAKDLGVGLISDDSKELAKVRAELHTKCREAQTWKEQAERVEKSNLARGALLEAVGAALQLNEPIRWDPLPCQVAALKKSESEWIKKAYEQNDRVAPEKARADAEFKRRVDAETYIQFHIEKKKHDDEKQQNIAQAGELQRRGELLVKTCEALDVDKWDDLPGAAEGMMEVLGRKTENAYASEEDLAVAQKNITDILTAQLRDVGIASAAGAVAGYFVDMVKLSARHDEVRKLLGANVGESVVDAANRVVGDWTQKANTWEGVIVETRRAAGIDHESVGSGSYTSLAKWCGDARAKLATAIFPLPKPEKVATGQRWTKIVTVSDDALVHGSESRDYVRSSFGILYKESLLGSIDGWLYLGT